MSLNSGIYFVYDYFMSFKGLRFKLFNKEIISKSLYFFSAFYLLISLSAIVYFANQAQSTKQYAAGISKSLNLAEEEYKALKEQDQYVINQKLKADIDKTHKSFNSLVSVYEQIQDLKAQKLNTDEYEKIYAGIVKDLGDLNYSSASGKLASISANIKKEKDKIASESALKALKIAGIPNVPATVSNNAPQNGFAFQRVSTETGEFSTALIGADLNSTKVIVDTASDQDCRDNCPVMPLGDFVSRNGAFAGINGSYFCPAAYPSCAGKTNSFDTLVMNKNKYYFNSDNNVYSNVPVAIFGQGFARFIGQSSGWGRDTGVDGVIANQPLLLSGGNISFGGSSDPKQGSRGTRSFVSNKGSIVYIGVIYNTTVAEMAYVLKALGMENALNLDSGGSTALWYGGYKAGPGRNIPNAILFVKR